MFRMVRPPVPGVRSVIAPPRSLRSGGLGARCLYEPVAEHSRLGAVPAPDEGLLSVLPADTVLAAPPAQGRSLCDEASAGLEEQVPRRYNGVVRCAHAQRIIIL